MGDRDRDAGGRFVAGNHVGCRGRPPDKDSLTRMLRTSLADPVVLPDGKELTRGKVVVARLVAMAMAGDLGAIRCILDRLEGRVNWSEQAPEEEHPRLIRPPFRFPAAGSCPSRASQRADGSRIGGGDGDAKKEA